MKEKKDLCADNFALESTRTLPPTWHDTLVLPDLLTSYPASATNNTRSCDNEISPTDVAKQSRTFLPARRVARMTTAKRTGKRDENKSSRSENDINSAALNTDDNRSSFVSPGAVAVPGACCNSSLASHSNNNIDALDNVVDVPLVPDRAPSFVVEAQVVTQHHNQEHDMVTAKVLHPNITPIVKQFYWKKPCVLLCILLCTFGSILGAIISLWLQGTSHHTPDPISAPTPNPTDYDETQIGIMNILRSHPNLTIDEDWSSGTPQSRALEWMLSTSNSSTLMENGSLSGTAVLERYGLAVFFYSTNGPFWNEQHHLLTESNVCNWNRPSGPPRFPYGVFCDNNAKVQEIRLSQSNLSGTIASELSLLTKLQVLDLATNYLNSVIPTELGRLTAMRVLSMQGNRLFGPLPTELGNLVALEMLSLGDNQFTGTMPKELGRLTILQVLHVYGNDMSSLLPTELGLMTSLMDLSTHINSFTGPLPTELGRLTNLQLLSVASNGLWGPLPTELGLMTSLIDIYARSNSFTGTLPTELGRLTDLQLLSLTANDLMGSLPSELGLMTSMTGVSVGYNCFTGTLPTELGQLTALESLSVNFNCLRGSIPSELANNSNVEVVFDPQKSP